MGDPVEGAHPKGSMEQSRRSGDDTLRVFEARAGSGCWMQVTPRERISTRGESVRSEASLLRKQEERSAPSQLTRAFGHVVEDDVKSMRGSVRSTCQKVHWTGTTRRPMRRSGQP